jgi:thiol-disulfide isomerase/thioredoxin
MACLLAMVSVPAWAQDEKKDSPSAEEKKDDRHPGIIELEKILEREASSEEELFNNIRTAVKVCEEVKADAVASARDKQVATNAALDLSLQGHMVGVVELGDKLRELCAAEVKASPASLFAPKAAFYLFKLDNYDRQKGPKEGILANAAQYLEKYPDEKRIGFELLMEVADQASEFEMSDLALAAYKDLLKRYPDTNMTEAIEGNVRRMEAVGKEFPIEGSLLSGEKIDPAQFKGKVVVLDFWATWCGPCLAELPELKRVYEELHDKGLEVIGVSLDEERAELEAFLEEKRLPWPQLYPEKDQPNGWENSFTRKYGISGIPTVFLIGRDGKLVSTSLRGSKLEAKIRELLDQKS